MFFSWQDEADVFGHVCTVLYMVSTVDVGSLVGRHGKNMGDIGGSYRRRPCGRPQLTVEWMLLIRS